MNKDIDWLYEHNKTNKERYILGKEGRKILLCIGINPSTATPEKLDNTLTRVNSISKDLGYNGWIMINIYPQRATNPDNLHKRFQKKSHLKNMETISRILKNREFDIWAAWGTLIEKRTYLKNCLCDIYKLLGHNPQWFTIGKKSIKGHPHHPLYLKNGLLPDNFDIENYIYSLK